MADPVGTAKQVVKIVLAIRTAVQTVRRNDEECREIEQLATRVSRILSQLQETESDPAMDGAMAGLEKSLDRALNLVTTCQKRSAMHRVCAAGAMARKLRRVQDDILRQLMLGVFATTTQLTLSLNMLQQPGAGAPPPRSQRPSSLGAGNIAGVFCCLSFCSTVPSTFCFLDRQRYEVLISPSWRGGQA